MKEVASTTQTVPGSLKQPMQALFTNYTCAVSIVQQPTSSPCIYASPPPPCPTCYAIYIWGSCEKELTDAKVLFAPSKNHRCKIIFCTKTKARVQFSVLHLRSNQGTDLFKSPQSLDFKAQQGGTACQSQALHASAFNLQIQNLHL